MKQSIPTLSLTDHVKVWLANSCQPNLLHIFDRACNLVNERKEVLSIVTPQTGNGPFQLVLENNICFSDYLNIESPLFTSSDQINLGNLTIQVAGATTWNPRPDWEKLHARRDNIANQISQLQITNYLHSSIFDGSCLNEQGLQITQSLSSSLCTLNLPSSLTAAQKLAGLGVGLTPAGDDFLMGVIYAAWIIHPTEVASVLSKEIANTAAPLTTSLSAAWLCSAGKGEAGALWHKFFDALVSNDLAGIQETMKNILAVGETSGADAMAGFIGVFISLREEANSKYG